MSERVGRYMVQAPNISAKDTLSPKAIVLDGKQLSAAVRAELKTRIERNRSSRPGSRAPGLGVVLVGNNPASRIYINAKMKAAAEVGIAFFLKELPETASEQEVRRVVESLNADSEVDGIIFQLPVPAQINANNILSIISPAKDVDGLHPISLGNLVTAENTGSVRPSSFAPCTPRGVMTLIDLALSVSKTPGAEIRYDKVPSPLSLEGKQALVIGRSRLVGKPAAFLLLERNATVSIAHSKTADLERMVRAADIVVAAAGRADLVKSAWLKPGSIVIDVGMNRTNGKLVGDVETSIANAAVFAYSPVPGGVGPMTVAMLLSNTVHSWEQST